MGYFARSWELGKTSWRVLRKDKELLWLPVLGGVASLVIAGIVFGLIVLVDYDPSVGWTDFEPSGGSVLLVILGVIASAIAVYFFQGALVAGARERLTGGDPTVASAIRGASGRIGAIAPWAIVALVVGFIINTIQAAARDRAGFVGALFGSLLDLAWRVMTFLVMPIIIAERVGPFRALGRSKDLLRRTWGENLVAQAGLSIVGFVLMAPGLLIAIFLGSGALGVFGVIVGGLLMILGAVVASALSAVYQTALYEYATTGESPAEFAEVDLGRSFGHRDRRSRWGQPGQYRT
ncbi:MAG: DUF6159 family protein [bacterium]|nr:DUF6159 family protein [bacterium]MCY3926485.1 DUF6159 family protein [bacterium]